MFFESDRLPIVQRMILAKSTTERSEAIAELLPLQREDFAGLFEAMDGLPVIIRLLDPPLHEFMPAYDELIQDLADLKVRLQHFPSMSEIDQALDEIRAKQNLLERVKSLREANPMLGLRGVRLGILIPDLPRMQVRAIFEAACRCAKEGVEVHPRGDDPARRTRQRAESAAAGGRGRGAERHGGAEDRGPPQVRHHDRGSACGTHRRGVRPEWPSSSPLARTT